MTEASYKASAEGSAPPPSGGGRSQFSDPRARARHAALVRWKKENPIAANVQERLAQIRAARIKKKKGGGGKGKGKGGAAKPNKAAQATANRSAALSKMRDKPNDAALGALDALRKGDAVDADMASSLAEETGLVQKRKDGTFTLSPSGHKLLSALDKGDAAAASDAMSAGQDATDKAYAKEKAKADKQAEREGKRAEREKARANRKEARGKKKEAKPKEKGEASAKPDPEKEKRAKEHDEDRAQRQKEHAEDRAQRAKDKAQRDKEHAEDRAQRQKDRDERDKERKKREAERSAAGKEKQQRAVEAEVSRIAAARARKNMDELTPLLEELEAIKAEALEIIEEEEDAIKAGARHNASDSALVQSIYDACEDICEMAIQLGATPSGDEEEEGGGEEEADMMMEGKAETFGGKKREDLSDSDFAGPDRTYPIMTAADVKDAASLIGKAENPDAVKRRIISIAKRKGFADALPEAWKEETKAEYTIDGDAIKSLADGRIGAYAVRFGSADEPDMSHMRDYFTKSTDFWLDAWDRRPMLYHHAMDDDTADAPRIGTWTKAEVKDEGVWLEGQLDRSHRYYSAIKELVRRGALRLSSDSAPHLVRRETKGDTHEVTRWPLLAASLTPTPAEPRLTAVSFKALIAELGIDDTDNPEVDETEDRERADALKAVEDRTRRLLLELDLLTLEATIV